MVSTRNPASVCMHPCACACDWTAPLLYCNILILAGCSGCGWPHAAPAQPCLWLCGHKGQARHHHTVHHSFQGGAAAAGSSESQVWGSGFLWVCVQLMSCIKKVLDENVCVLGGGGGGGVSPVSASKQGLVLTPAGHCGWNHACS